METNDLQALAYELADIVRYHPLVVALATLEQELDNDETVKKLSASMHQALEDFERSQADGSETEAAQKRLHVAKRNLDEHPLVRRYYAAFGPVRVLYERMQAELFTPFNLHLCWDNHP